MRWRRLTVVASASFALMATHLPPADAYFARTFGGTLDSTNHAATGRNVVVIAGPMMGGIRHYAERWKFTSGSTEPATVRIEILEVDAAEDCLTEHTLQDEYGYMEVEVPAGETIAFDYAMFFGDNLGALTCVVASTIDPTDPLEGYIDILLHGKEQATDAFSLALTDHGFDRNGNNVVVVPMRPNASTYWSPLKLKFVNRAQRDYKIRMRIFDPDKRCNGGGVVLEEYLEVKVPRGKKKVVTDGKSFGDYWGHDDFCIEFMTWPNVRLQGKIKIEAYFTRLS